MEKDIVVCAEAMGTFDPEPGYHSRIPWFKSSGKSQPSSDMME